jgi:hypothetical protein
MKRGLGAVGPAKAAARQGGVCREGPYLFATQSYA